MIKRVYLYSVLAYFLPAAVVHFWNNGRHPDWKALAYIPCFSAVLAGVGLFIGVFFCAVYQRPSREKWFYILGQILPSGFILFGIVYSTMNSSEPKTINQENERYVADNSRDSPQLGVAFDSLRSQFSDPNGFKIETSLALDRDTIIHFMREPVWTITFAYSLPQAKLKERYATFIVQDSVARMIRFNRSQAEPEYIRMADKMKEIKQFADSVEKLYNLK